MRLPMFDLMDETIALMEQRQDYYLDCANELQALIKSMLASDPLLGVHVRVKSEKSLREKILRKHLYRQFDNKYDLLTNLSDLVGLRAECRFMREEIVLYHMLEDACAMQHADGTCSLPDCPTIRFDFSTKQPQEQQNGLSIFRIDGKYHKNGVTVPFELQIKSLVHVFWAEVEHQLIYKNSNYVLMDDFLKKLLYSNYDSLKQIDENLQLIYDHMQVRQPRIYDAQYSNIRPIVAKVISDVFLTRMHGQMGYSLRLNSACDILAQYLLVRCEASANPLNRLIEHIRAVPAQEIAFDHAIELEGAYTSNDPFHNTVGLFISQQINMNYDWNVFFRMLFAMEECGSLESFSAFIAMYCARFQREELYAALPAKRRKLMREQILAHLGDVLTSSGDLSILFEETVSHIEDAIRDICAEGCEEPETLRLCLQCAMEQA